MLGSEEQATIDLIINTPTDRAPRLALVDIWGDDPKAELVRPLMEMPFPSSARAIQDWFERHHGWPGESEVYPCACFDSDGRIGDFVAWLGGSFAPERWANRAAWHAAVVAVARRMLPNAQTFFPADDRARRQLERTVASKPTDPPGTYDGMDAAARHVAKHEPALVALWAARRIASHCYDMIGDSPGDARNAEMMEQYHVLGWSWLGLPPLRPEGELQEPLNQVPGMPKGQEPAIEKPQPWWRRLLG